MRTRLLLIGLVVAAVSVAQADLLYTVHVDQADSMDLIGDPDNVTLVVDVAVAVGLPAGTPIELTGLGWSADLMSESPSTLAEMTAFFDDAVAPDFFGIDLRPGVNDGFPGSQHYQSDVVPIGLSLPDGRIFIEFYEDSNDHFSNAADGMWMNTDFVLQVTPEPAALALLATGVVVLGRKR